MDDRPKYFVLDEDKNPRPIDDVLQWAQEFEMADRRKVARDEPIAGVTVSTVFLGVDHAFFGGPPLLFETMTFGGLLDQEMIRTSTWPEAEVAHQRMVDAVRRSGAHGHPVTTRRRVP